MDISSQLGQLIDLAEEIGLEIRPSPPAAEGSITSGGALIRLRGREIIFLNTQATVADQIELVASALQGHAELDSRFIPPEIRELIDGDHDRAGQ